MMFGKFVTAAAIALFALAAGIFAPIMSSAAMPVDDSLPVIKSPKATKDKYDDKIVITWGKNKNSKTDKYLVMRKSLDDTSWHRLGFVSNNKNKYVDKISGDTKYYRYKVLCIKKKDGVNYKSDLSASGTAAGNCLVTVCIDPGHYGSKNNNFKEKGKNAEYPYSEGEQMLQLGIRLEQRLEELGINAVMTRTDGDVGAKGVDISDNGLDTRGVFSKGCDLFVSLHTNATGAVKNVWDQPENKVYVFANALAQKGGKLTLAKRLGSAVTDCLKETGALDYDSGIKKFNEKDNDDPDKNGCTLFRRLDNGKDYYAVLRSAAAVGTPAVLIEHSYHVNPDVRKYLLDDEKLDELASAEAKAIASYYGFIK